MLDEGNATEKVSRKRSRRTVVQNGETLTTSQVEDFAAISYPVQSDTRGKARISFRRKSYHFGDFDSAQSFVLFGLWKARLEQTGEAPTCASLRPIAEAAIKEKPLVRPRSISRVWFVLTLALGLSLIAAANYAGYRIYSTFKPVEVDGIPMSAREKRSLRSAREIRAKIEAEVEARTPTRFDEISEDVKRRILEGKLDAIHKKQNSQAEPIDGSVP